MNIALPDKIMGKKLEENKIKYLMASDEGEAISIACGFYYATGKTANVYISADGFMNALNAITSYAIPEMIPINIFISIGRNEKQHRYATLLVPKIIKELKKYDSKKIHYEFVEKE